MVVGSSCDYFAEISFTDHLQAGLRIARLGSSSITYDISLFRNEDEFSAASGQFTHVNVSRTDKRPVPITDAARAVFETLS